MKWAFDASEAFRHEVKRVLSAWSEDESETLARAGRILPAGFREGPELDPGLIPFLLRASGGTSAGAALVAPSDWAPLLTKALFSWGALRRREQVVEVNDREVVAALREHEFPSPERGLGPWATRASALGDGVMGGS